ncbi:MAG: metallophosphoesterase [Deltaproteobacteria bacterium]|nr:metallophosphoesterase [Deltaproteobacteria bacterium]
MQTESTVQIAHLSDLHLPLPVPMPLAGFVSKRLLGWLNLRLLRTDHELARFERLLELAAGRGWPELTVLSGDLVNLALPAEYEQVCALMRRGGLEPARCMVLPGNHDRYTPSADAGGAFERGMRDWLPPGFGRRSYPQVRVLGPLLVIGLDSAVWRGPIRAAGRLDRAQLGRLPALLDSHPGLHPVIALHHPPWRLDGPLMHHYRAGLAGFASLLAAIGDRPATVLCGHLHRALRRRAGRVEILAAPSASLRSGDPLEQSACHVYTFDAGGLRQARAWRYGDRFEEVDLAGL